MAVAAPSSPSDPIQITKRSEEKFAEWWVEPIKWVALAVFVAIPLLGHLQASQPYTGRIVWTVVVASLPLFIVLVGYHRWRRICPLAFFSQLPVRMRRPGIKKASAWLEGNYYYVAFSIFFFSLWVRLIATNGDGHAIAVFFVLISFAALLFGAFYTGKTWCNYICPLSFIEKIYTEPNGLRETRNSQCAKCTACKKFCPDINEENGYWKEIDSKPKKFAYFTFPGLVFGFYFYYYLQSGTWDAYFKWRWFDEEFLVHHVFDPGRDSVTQGFFFFPIMPRAAAAILALAACALLSFLLFFLLERLVSAWLRRRDPETDTVRVRHIMFAMAAFTAFVTFYSFAGAPTLWKAPWVIPQLFIITVVFTGTLFLARRLGRNQKSFAEETLARNIIKRWEWTDIKPPKDLREAFLIHTIRARESAKGFAQILEIYKDAVRDTLANGYVTREELKLLESLRNQLQIKNSDHEKIMAALADEERALLSDPSKQLSAEKRLQLETYKRALQSHLEKVLAEEADADDRFITQLRSEFRVTRAEHASVMDELMGGAHGMARKLAEELKTIDRAARAIKALAQETSAASSFLSSLLEDRRELALSRLIGSLGLESEDENVKQLRTGLRSDDDAERVKAMEELRYLAPSGLGENLLEMYGESSAAKDTESLDDVLRDLTDSADPYVRSVSIHLLAERGTVDKSIIETLVNDDHEVVRETALHINSMTHDRSMERHSGLITIEKMVALRTAPMFDKLGPSELAELARASRELFYEPDQPLCIEGERGNEVFIVLSGEVAISRTANGIERVVAVEGSGSLIGEMAVLDPAPRSATVRAGKTGAQVLRLDGDAFRDALNNDPTIASSIIRTLAHRLRRVAG